MRSALVVSALLLSFVGAAGSPAAAAPRELVIGNEALLAGGKHVPANMEAFARRLEALAGWPKGSLKAKAFTSPREALEHVRKNGSAFAILPPHQFVQARKELKLEVLGRAVGVEGTNPAFWGVARNEKRPYSHIESYPGLRLTGTELYDLQWIDVLFEDNVEPATHFKYVPAATPDEAIAAVLAKKADVAVVYQRQLDAMLPRLQGVSADLTTVYASGGVPPSAVLAVGKHASKADRKKLTAALGKMCKGEGGDVCARMGIVSMEPGRAETYRTIIAKYESY